MRTLLSTAELLANMPPPHFRVAVPPGREMLYAAAAPLCLSVAAVAGGLWCLRRKALRPGPRRGLLWLAAGCLAVAYSSHWVWSHRHDGTMSPDLAAWVAVSMPWLWGSFVVIV